MSNGRESTSSRRWPWIASLAALGILAGLTFGCRTASRGPASVPGASEATSPPAPSLEDLAAAVARVLDERKGRPSVDGETIGVRAPIKSRPESIQAPVPAPGSDPAVVDVGRLSVDELTAVVGQILRERQLGPATGNAPAAEVPPGPAGGGGEPGAPAPAVVAASPQPGPVSPPETPGERRGVTNGLDAGARPIDRDQRVAALVARILRESFTDGAPGLTARAGATAEVETPSVAAAPRPAPPPLVPPTVTAPQPAPPTATADALSEEAVARIVLRVMQEQRRSAQTPAAVPTDAPARRPQEQASGPPLRPVTSAGTGVSTPTRPTVSRAPSATSPSFDELVRAVEKALRDDQSAAPRRMAPPRDDEPVPLGTPTSWIPVPPVGQDESTRVVVRMQSSSLPTGEPDRPASADSPRTLLPSLSRVSDQDLARAIALILKRSAHRDASGTAARPGGLRPRAEAVIPAAGPSQLEEISAPPPTSAEVSPPSPDRPPEGNEARASPSPDIDRLARQVALILKARLGGQATPSVQGAGSPGSPTASPGEPLPPMAIDPLARTSALGEGPVGVLTEGEGIAAGVGGDAFAFSNPFLRGPGGGAGSCATCGRTHPGASALEDDDCTSCGRAPCQGQTCYPFPANTAFGRFLGEIYEGICCPDPCYQPTWIPEANAAFFIDYARPQTLTRFRYDYMNRLEFPDRSEYVWAQAMRGPKGAFQGKGPVPPKLRGPGGHYLRGWSYINRSVGSFYTEAASDRASVFVEIPYASVDAYPKAPAGLPAFRHSAGFSDMNVGAKSLLFDSKAMQLTFQFRTYLPIGDASQGLGNGHVSLEPSLLTSIRLGPETYFQGQLAEWIPIGGDPNYAGSILEYGFSINQVLWRCTPDIPLIGTFEMDGWSFQSGLFTNPFTGPAKSSNETYFNLGPGLRMSICKTIDFGAAVSFPVSYHYWADPWVRGEFRIIF